MDLVPRGRIQHMLTRPRQHPLHSFDIPFFNYDIFSVFFSAFFFVIFIFMFTTSLAHWSGQYNLLFSSSRLRHTVSSLEDFFPGQRKNPKINWFCLHYSSLFTGKKETHIQVYDNVRHTNPHTRARAHTHTHTHARHPAWRDFTNIKILFSTACISLLLLSSFLSVYTVHGRRTVIVEKLCRIIRRSTSGQTCTLALSSAFPCPLNAYTYDVYLHHSAS